MIMGTVIYWKPMGSYIWKKCRVGCTWKKRNRTAKSVNKPVSGCNVTTSFHEWYPIMLWAKCSVTPSCAFLSCLNISLQETNYYLENVRRHSWSFWPFIGPLGYMDAFCISRTSQCLLATVRSAILQDGVTRCYPIRFPTVHTVHTTVSWPNPKQLKKFILPFWWWK